MTGASAKEEVEKIVPMTAAQRKNLCKYRYSCYERQGKIDEQEEKEEKKPEKEKKHKTPPVTKTAPPPPAPKKDRSPSQKHEKPVRWEIKISYVLFFKNCFVNDLNNLNYKKELVFEAIDL